MEDEKLKITSYKELLKGFSALPKPNTNPTYMDICHMVGDRFEEKCSKILKFFFQPNGPHKMHSLFLKSLLEIIDKGHECFYHETTIKVLTEETTEDRKRIDITIKGDNFVIAIENKIEAETYNPFDSYVRYIEKQYNNIEKRKYVVLSIRKITKRAELDKLSKLGYAYINYDEFFSVIKKNLGSYATECDQSYLSMLFDFIRTIENKYYNKNMEEVNKFFFENHQRIDEFVKGYENFKNNNWSKQCNEIASICTRLNQETNADWKIYQGWDLVIAFNEGTDKNIGIEANYETDYHNFNPLGIFKAFITVWNKSCFDHYDGFLKKKYPGCSIDRNPQNDKNRVYLHLPVIENASIDIIVAKMVEYYNDLREIAEQVNK